MSNRGGERGRRHPRAESRAPDPAKDPNRALKAATLVTMHGDVAGTGFLKKLGEAFECSRQAVHFNATAQSASILSSQGKEGIKEKFLAGKTQREAPISSWPAGLKIDMFNAAEQARLRALWNPSSAPAASPGKRSRERSLQHAINYSARCAVETARIVAGETTSRKAAKQMCAEGFKIGSSTLRTQIGKYHGKAPQKVGRPTWLTPEEEAGVVDWVKLMRTYKMPVTKPALVKKIILALGDSVEERLPGGQLGKKWYTGFLRRHSIDLGTLATGSLESGRDDWYTTQNLNPHP